MLKRGASVQSWTERRDPEDACQEEGCEEEEEVSAPGISGGGPITPFSVGFLDERRQARGRSEPMRGGMITMAAKKKAAKKKKK
jgi:hypothetical protein